MKRVDRRLAAVGASLTLGAAAAFLGKAYLTHNERQEAWVHEITTRKAAFDGAADVAQAYETRQEKTTNARKAIAGQYASCAIVRVEDTHTSKVYPSLPGSTPRNKVVVTVNAELTQQALALENSPVAGVYLPDEELPPRVYKTRYDTNGDRILDIKGEIPARRHVASDQPGQRTFTLTMYPKSGDARTGDPRTTQANISLESAAMTQRPTGELTQFSVGRISCGDLVEGPGGWKVNTDIAAIPPLFVDIDCDSGKIVTIPAVSCDTW